MTNIVPCMGGFCSKRDGCVHYHSTADMNPSERLCGQGKDEPETAKALGFTPMAIEKRVVRIDTNVRANREPTHMTTHETPPLPAVGSPVERVVRPTHWKDERGYVLTDAQREARGFDWQQAYSVPCKVGAFGRIVPLHKCGHCGGKGRDPKFSYDPCPVCGRSGGLSGPNAEVTGLGRERTHDEQ